MSSRRLRSIPMINNINNRMMLKKMRRFYSPAQKPKGKWPTWLGTILVAVPSAFIGATLPVLLALYFASDMEEAKVVEIARMAAYDAKLRPTVVTGNEPIHIQEFKRKWAQYGKDIVFSIYVKKEDVLPFKLFIYNKCENRINEKCKEYFAGMVNSIRRQVKNKPLDVDTLYYISGTKSFLDWIKKMTPIWKKNGYTVR